MLAAGSLPCATPVVLSTDVGNEIDDQWAIAYMLVNPAFDVLGIVSAHAPSLPAPSAHATYEVLKDEVEHRLGMKVHPPLFEGSSLPLADKTTPRPNNGVDFIIQASKRFSKDHRLIVLTIGAATDVASALLQDPEIVDRIEVVAMGFRNLSEGGNEYNVENDPKAWQVILDSAVPVTIGSGDVCQRDLALSFEGAKKLIGGHGPVGAWLWDEYQAWYFRFVKPLRIDDFSKPWVIWDTVVLAYVQGMTTQKTIPRPRLAANLSFEQASTHDTITWITSVDASRMWEDFLTRLDEYERTHALGQQKPLRLAEPVGNAESGAIAAAINVNHAFDQQPAQFLR
jgi:purine nucleosidase